MIAVQLDLFEDNSEESINRKFISKISNELGNVRRGTFKRIGDLQARCLHLEENCDRLEKRLSKLEKRNVLRKPKQGKNMLLVEGF